MKAIPLISQLLFFILSLQMINKTMAQTDQYISAKEAKGLEVGTTAPDWSAKTGDDEELQLDILLKKGPVVMVFYRGQWCPVCNKHLSELEENLQKLTNKGAQVVAISPEKSAFLEKTREKTNASFSLLHDEDYKIADAYGVKFRPDSATRAMYNTVLGANLKKAHSDGSQQLPIPATYIIDTDKTIVWRHFDPNYKKRASAAEISQNLPE